MYQHIGKFLKYFTVREREFICLFCFDFLKSFYRSSFYILDSDSDPIFVPHGEHAQQHNCKRTQGKKLG